MTVLAEGRIGREGLVFLHDRLEQHFSALRAKRDVRDPDIPLFALEHGLSESELLLLNAEICSAVRQGRLPHDTWLPFVVYSAEIGYEYSGEEFWPTFESRTPGWVSQGDRQYIRRLFRQFSDRFGAARPSGAWATQFSIICWPITHAVLPTDLQRQFARLLFEYRTALTSDLLREPAELGRRLAARALHSSSRFQNFAQNTELLGQVAAALLVGDDEDSPYLLDSTLKRIVADLSEERESRRWLRDAKVSASQLRLRGFEPGSRRATEGTRDGARVRLPATTDPEISLRRDLAGWTAYIEISDLTTLAERLPAAHDELGRLRARLAGVSGPPLARGRLLYPGQHVRLDHWPLPGEPLITLENGSPATNSLLSDQCVFPPGPRWLFRKRDDSTATQVRGMLVRPGRSYLLLAREPISGELPPTSSFELTRLSTDGVYAYAVRVPDILDADDLRVLANIGLAVVTEIELRPAGFVPAVWDGEGTAEWNVGEDPIVAVSSSRAVERCIFTLDGEPYLVPWPTGDQEVFVQVGALDVGTHELRVALLSSEVEQPVAEGVLSLMMRTPPTRRSTGTLRGGLVILATPVSPTLTELWDGTASLELRGPEGVEVKVDLALCDRAGKTLARHALRVSLPVDSQRWLRLFKQIGAVGGIQRAYEQSEACRIEITHPELGSAALFCEREFTPLRWVFGRDSDGPFVRLIDNTDGNGTRIDCYAFAAPDRSTTVDLSAGMRWRGPGGGLVTATAGDNQASVILPPFVHDLTDLRTANITPTLKAGTRSEEGVRRAIKLTGRWSEASLPADPFGEIRRTAVLRAITAHIASLIGGDRWEHLERRLLIGRDSPSMSELRDGVGEQRYQRELALDLSHHVGRLQTLQPEKRAAPLAFALHMHAPPAGVRPDDSRFAEFLLRLASDPTTLLSWPAEDCQVTLRRALDSPVVLRAARYVVLAIDGATEEVAGVTYAGWAWE
jgi:hypothetical protein